MNKKIVFMGTSNFAVPILKSLYQNGYPISVVYTQPPKKSNRGLKLSKSPINLFAENITLDVRTPQSLKNNNEEELFLNELKPDIILVVSFGQMIPKNLLNIPKYGFLNVHASLLPKWRGAAPIQRAIMNMDSETGISIMKIEPELDSGPVMLQSKIKIHPNFNCEEQSKEMSKIGAKLILDALELIEANKAKFQPQNESEITYAKKIAKTEAKINWREDAQNILAKINALNPNPGCWFELDGSRVKIIKAKKIICEGKPGMVLDEKFTIGCLKNAIQILEVKKEGKNKMIAKEFLKGNRIKVGQNLN